MKSMHILTLAMILALIGLIAVGCSEKGGAAEGEDGEKKVSGIVPVYTPGAGGISYILSAGIGKIFNSGDKMPGVQLVTEATNGGAEIVQMTLDKANANQNVFGINAVVDVAEAYNGEYDKIPGEQKNLRAVAFMNYAAAHMIVSADSKIETLADLKGKKVGLPPGSATESIIKAVLKDGYGLEDGDYKVLPLGYNEIQEGIQDGSIDAGPLLGAIPAPLVNELAQLKDVRLLTVDKEAEEKFLAANPYYTMRTVEANTYPGQDKEVVVPSMDVIAFTHEGADEELVYNFIDTILSNKEEMDSIHPAAKDINNETIFEGLEIPMHPGAERYMKEHME
ncbi:TAXI family TRAP transporter solute-binding subunit [Sporosarcina sp. FSL W7-1349]|uniref:TAXI family TRAP transporter solute-binding subunit n=1 Tax=Sporosarcina sp. FSL W7-1349 TaxID=2921561 RepID=UPI0030F697D9